MVLGMCFFEVEIKYKLEAKITFFNKNHKNQSADTSRHFVEISSKAIKPILITVIQLN